MSKNKKTTSSSQEKLPTNELIINAIYQDSEDGSMFYVTSKPEPVPGEEGYYYYNVVRTK